jgi:tetratricopeptide (TPR) repeat protein
VVHHAEEVLAY